MKKVYLLALLLSLGFILVHGSSFANAQESPAPGQTFNQEGLLDFEQNSLEQDAALKRLKECTNPLNCKILDAKGRKVIREVIIQRLTDAQGYFNGACTNLKIRELVKKINEQKEKQERQETVAFILEISVSLAHPWLGATLGKMVATLKPNTLQAIVLKHVAQKGKTYIDDVAKKLEDKVAKKSADWLMRFKEETTDRIDLSNVSQFCSQMAGGFNVLIDRIRTNVINDKENIDNFTQYSDLELLSMLSYYHPDSISVRKYEEMLGDLFSRFELQVLSIGREDNRVYPGTRKGSPSEYTTSQKSLYIMRDDNNNQFLALIERVVRQLDNTKISATYAALSGIDDDLKKFAIQRSKILNIPITDLDIELKSMVESKVPIILKWFPPAVNNRYRSFKPKEEEIEFPLPPVGKGIRFEG